MSERTNWKRFEITETTSVVVSKDGPKWRLGIEMRDEPEDEWGGTGAWVSLSAGQLRIVAAGLLALAAEDVDTGHRPHACDCGHHWDSHMAVYGGCSLCSCKAHPPNQPQPLDEKGCR